MRYAPTRGRLLVSNVSTTEKIGSIIVPEDARAKLTNLQVVVEATGAPWWNEESCDYELIPAKEGDWLVLVDRWCRQPTEDPDLWVIGINDLAARMEIV